MPPRRLTTVALAVIVSLSATACAARATPPAVDAPGTSWQQTFGDDFDGPVLDPLRWTTCYFWVSAGGCTNTANGELQWYLPGNVSVSDGTLRLRALPEHVVAPSGKAYDYTSGMVSTGRSTGLLGTPPRYAFTYGYAEIRMKLPKGQGLWPAFWLLPSSQAWPPELDVFENIGNKPTTLSMTDHYVAADGSSQSFGSSDTGPDFSAGWHTVGLDWRPDRLTWFVDGVARHATTDPRMIPQEPMYLLANLAVGGSWPGSPDAGTTFPAEMAIDFIRVWQRVADQPASTPPAATAAPSGTTAPAAPKVKAKPVTLKHRGRTCAGKRRKPARKRATCRRR